jgi:hypothetical protein
LLILYGVACKFVYYLSQINHFCFIYILHIFDFFDYFHPYKCVYYISCLVIANYIPLLDRLPYVKILATPLIERGLLDRRDIFVNRGLSRIWLLQCRFDVHLVVCCKPYLGISAVSCSKVKQGIVPQKRV